MTDKLPIPKGVFEQHVIVLGKTRSGKSSAMRLMAESLLDDEKPVCIVDPKGDWWGIKSSADGRHAGYPLVIFGGEHADVPINRASGPSVAELFATGNRPCLVDLGGWMVAERTEFFIGFASTLFKLTRGRRWLVIDEVHNFCPKGKVLDPKAGQMLHWANRLASEGLGKGLAMLAASQRPQKVHNDFLTSCETLIAMRVIHKSDRDAIKDWIDGAADPQAGKEVLATLASMARGEGWAWSPEMEFGPKRIQFPMFSTYDSFRPQKVELPARLKGWADVDLDEVKKKLATVLKEAEASDPEKLRARIRELEREILGGARRVLISALEKQRREFERFHRQTWHEVSKAVTGAMNQAIRQELPKVSGAEIQTKGEATAPNPHSLNRNQTVPPKPPRPIAEVTANGDSGLTPRQIGILRAIAEFEAIGRSQISKAWIAARSGASYTSSAYTNNLGALRSGGYINYPGPDLAALTEKGRAAAGDVNVPQTSEEMLQSCLSLLVPAQQKILKVLYERREPMPKSDLAEAVGASAASSAFTNNLGALRSAGMIEYPAPGEALIADWLFID